MLAPLKERSIQECDAGSPVVDQPTKSKTQFHSAVEEIQDLRRALKESRIRLRRSAWESTTRIAALSNEVSRLSALCTSFRQQVVRYESGVAIVELGCKLMQLSEKNEALNNDSYRVWTLERTIEAAHAEYCRLSLERDALMQELCLNKFEQFEIVRS